MEKIASKKEGMKQKGIQKKIKKNVLTLVLTVLGILGLITCYLNYSSTNKTLKQTMQEIAEIAAERVMWEVTAYENVAADIGTMPEMSDDAFSVEQKQELIDQKVKEYGLVRGKMISPDGIAHIDGTDYNDRAYFAASMKGEDCITEPMVAKTSGELSIIISAPVWKGGIVGSEIAGVVFVVPKETFLNEIVETINVSSGGSAYILDANGNTIAHRNMDLVVNKSNTMADAQTDSSLKALAKLEGEMVAGHQGFGTYSYEGAKKLLTYAPIDNTAGWSIAITAPTKDFISDTIVGIIITIVIVVISALIAGWLAGRLARDIAVPLQLLSARLATFAKGELTEAFPEINSQDEIGKMVHAAKDMADNLAVIIRDAEQRLGEMAKGNYAVESTIPEKYVGEFQSLDTSINQLNLNMNDTLHQIEEASAQVFAGSGSLAEGAQNLAEGAEEQASAVEELLAAVTDVTEGAQKTAERVDEAFEVSCQCAKEADLSRVEMENMVEVMDHINETSKKIENIINDIEEIASQTNLLSLNASIEAARAGEAGKGFAVVADQIGKLAEESAKSAVNTRELIMSSIEEIKEGAKAAENAAQTIVEVVGGMNQLSNVTREVSTFTQNQVEAMDQVESGVNQISDVIQSNSATAQEASATSEELSAQAASLDELINQFVLKKNS